MNLHPERIHERLRRLAEVDVRRRVFGSMAHNYDLNPKLDEAAVAEFERQHGIRLPKDYRFFLTHIGNGGAGPAYGVFALGHDEDGPWTEHSSVGELNQEFPHTDSWNLDASFWDLEPELPPGIPEDETQRRIEEWDQRMCEHYWTASITNGAIPLADLGCGLSQRLVLTGPQRGFVWNDLRADHAGLTPAVDDNGRPLTFTAWYLAWLDRAEQTDFKRDVPRHPVQSERMSRRQELLVLALLVAAGTLLGLAVYRYCCQ